MESKYLFLLQLGIVLISAHIAGYLSERFRITSYNVCYTKLLRFRNKKMLNTLKCSVRLIVIAKVLAKHGALFFFESLSITNFAVQMIKTTKTQKFMLSKGKRLANALIELGPSFIKLGQALSTRSDLLGSDVAEDLAMLHDELPPFSGDDAVKIIEKEFSRPIDALFSEFNKTVITSYSIHYTKLYDRRYLFSY